jgi:hypothetical protein
MSFKQKNITVTLVNFSLILIFFLFRVFQMIQNDSFNSENVFRLWGIIIILAVVVSIGATILTIIVSAVIDAIKTGKEEPEIDSLEDERDRLIDLRGTKVTYLISSIGSLIAMLTFVQGQPPLVMFTLLIFVGVLAQIIGDISRLVLYQRGA